MKRTTTIGKMYAVTSAAGCTVTTPDGLPICTVEAGTQGYFTAPTSTVEVDDDAALLTATFNRAASALGLLGGGVKSELPAGYLRAEWLENPTPRNALTVAHFTLQTEPISHEDVVEYETEHFFPLEPSNMFFEGLAVPEKAEEMGEVGMFSTSFGWGWRQSEKSCVFSEGLDNYPNRPGVYWGDLILDYSPSAPVAKWFKNTVKFTPDSFSAWVDGVQVAGFTGAMWHKSLPPRIETGVFGLLNYHKTVYSDRPLYGRKKSYTVIKNGKVVNKLVPCVAVDGEVTFFDKVSKKTVPRIGAAFIAGLTLAQARKLGKHLPERGGAMTISLPTGYEQDGGVMDALETARANGWTLTVQTYAAEEGASTFALRRIWVRKQASEHGGYVDTDGVRYSVEWCATMYTPDGSEPDAHGYEPFRSVEAATEYWGLTPYEYPEEELNTINV